MDGLWFFPSILQKVTVHEGHKNSLEAGAIFFPWDFANGKKILITFTGMKSKQGREFREKVLMSVP